MGRPPGAKNKNSQAAPEQQAEAAPRAQSQAVAVFHPARLPYHDAIEQRFGVDRGQWRVLTDAIFPAAQSVDAIVIALSYCKQRGLDIFKRPVHIVPMWDSKKGATVETVWPGISELRTTASRTGQYAGCDEAEFGPFKTDTFTGRAKQWDKEKGAMAWQDLSAAVTYPEWCRITIYRMIGGQPRKFVGPKVLWKESFATIGGSDVPNKMWQERPEGQLEKCAEAAALRRAFPEDIGNELTAEEMQGRTVQDLKGDAETIAAGAASRDTAPPRQITAPANAAPKADGPPRKIEKPDPERLPDAEEGDDAEDGEFTENPAPAEADDSMADDAPVAPHRILPTKADDSNHTTGTWADEYLERINACATLAETYEWITKNNVPLDILHKKDSKRSAQVRAAVVKKQESFRPQPGADKSKADDAPPRNTKAAPKRADKQASKAEGPGERPDGSDPEAFLKWVEAMLDTVTDADLLEDFYTEKVEPFVEDLMPPDRAECIAAYQRAEKRLGHD